MKKILFISTVYRTGEKVYPIINVLSSKYIVDFLNLYQMSQNTKWIGDCDVREKFYQNCNKLNTKIINGPEFVDDNDKNGISHFKFVCELKKHIDITSYSLIIWDNNITIKGGQQSEIYQSFKKEHIPVIACPHGNRDYHGYRIADRIGRIYDFSFVFGKKEKKHLIKINKNIKNLLFDAGIPSNDDLKRYNKKEKYILVLPNMIDHDHVRGQVKDFSVFDLNVFNEIKLMKLSEKHGIPIVIKEKNKMYCRSSVLRKSLKKYGVEFIMDSEDDNNLIADAKFVISAPSTMAFKSIQMKIPTVILKGHGMIGNFYDFPDLVDCNYSSIDSGINNFCHDKYDSFIKNTLSGGIDFSSTTIYSEHIDSIIK